MKDMYSFDKSETDAFETYEKMREAYHKIFKALELTYVEVEADSGNIIMNATETIKLESKKCLITTQAYTKICGSGTVEITANSVLNIYGSLLKAVTDSIAGAKESKFGGQKKLSEQLQTVTPTTDPYDLP